MSRLDNSIKIIGKLTGIRSGGWQFVSNVQGELVNVRIQRDDSPVATSIEFVNRVEFSDWMEDVAEELNIELNRIGAAEIIDMVRAG